MLSTIFDVLDDWIAKENADSRRDGFVPISKCEFRILGQLALMEARLNLNIALTEDFDAYSNAHHSVMTKLNQLLMANGLEFDLLSNEIWMPNETQYVEIYAGDWVSAFRAQPEFVMVSKARFAIEKNRILLREYIASAPPQIFFDLCQKYSVDIAILLRK